ncbi:GDSL family lipase, partial [Klebsiella sp. C244]
MVERYNTGNPRPSNSMKDLSDNAQAYDDFMNSENDTFIDRLENEKDTLAGATKKMTAAADAVVQDARQNLIPLSRQYMTLAAAQEDIANIPAGSTTYYRSPDDSALAIEVINNGGTLEPTGRKMPSQAAVDEAKVKADSVAESIYQNGDSETLVDFCDQDGYSAAKVSMDENGVGFKTSKVSLMPELLENAIFSFFKVTEDGFSVQDEDGRVLASFNNGVAKGLGITVKYDWIQQIVSMLGNNIGIESSAIRFYVDGNSSDIIT